MIKTSITHSFLMFNEDEEEKKAADLTAAKKLNKNVVLKLTQQKLTNSNYFNFFTSNQGFVITHRLNQFR